MEHFNDTEIHTAHAFVVANYFIRCIDALYILYIFYSFYNITNKFLPYSIFTELLNKHDMSVYVKSTLTHKEKIPPLMWFTRFEFITPLTTAVWADNMSIPELPVVRGLLGPTVDHLGREGLKRNNVARLSGSTKDYTVTRAVGKWYDQD